MCTKVCLGSFSSFSGNPYIPNKQGYETMKSYKVKLLGELLIHLADASSNNHIQVLMMIWIMYLELLWGFQVEHMNEFDWVVQIIVDIWQGVWLVMEYNERKFNPSMITHSWWTLRVRNYPTLFDHSQDIFWNIIILRYSGIKNGSFNIDICINNWQKYWACDFDSQGAIQNKCGLVFHSKKWHDHVIQLENIK